MKQILIFAFLLTGCLSIQLDCITDHGSKSHFTAIKPPKEITSYIKTYLVFDDESQDFVYHENEIDEANGPLNKTLSQFDQEGIQLLVWNDQPPGTKYYNPDGAHSKGIIAYSAESDSGVYIFHSFPRYPFFDENGKISADIHYSQTYLGQTFHCEKVTGKSIDLILSGIQITNITVNRNTLQSSSYQYINEFANQKYYVENEENFKKIELDLESGPAIGIYKRDTYDVQVYEDVVIPNIQDSIYSLSWGDPYIHSNCKVNGSYFVKNIGEIKFDFASKKSFLSKQPFSDTIEWSCYKEHSKWFITDKTQIPCIADMNHMESQNNRGGGFICPQNPNLHSALSNLIAWNYDCKGERKEFSEGNGHRPLKRIQK